MKKRLLITRTDIAEFKQISNTVNDKVLNPFIFEAQFVDLQKLMGSDFYNDLIRNYDGTSPNYKFLLDGGDYTYNAVTYSLVGIKSVLVHYTYARYVLLGSNIDTPFGHVVKMTNDSQPSSDANKKTSHKENQQSAFYYWENVVEYLDRNSAGFPLWKNGGCSSRTSGFRISKIGS